MNVLEYTFSGKKVQYFLDCPVSHIRNLVSPEQVIFIIDETVHHFHGEVLSPYKKIIIPAGEQNKNQSTVNFIINELVSLGADRTTCIVGMGGGVVTDITGFVAAIYMRGVRFGFVPTTILAQVDASIGGKNGIDTGLYKNLLGTIRQPEFILFDHALLKSLPEGEWINGFAEIIKHGCIKDAGLFSLLCEHELADFRKDDQLCAALIRRNIIIKSDVVENDEFENGERKLLNFGHTLGHAIENMYALPHGHAISIGMYAACNISEQLNDFSTDEKLKVGELLQRYGLPITYTIDKNHIFGILKMDKKRVSSEINFILLNEIGEATIRSIPLSQLENMI